MTKQHLRLLLSILSILLWNLPFDFGMTLKFSEGIELPSLCSSHDINSRITYTLCSSYFSFHSFLSFLSNSASVLNPAKSSSFAANCFCMVKHKTVQLEWRITAATLCTRLISASGNSLLTSRSCRSSSSCWKSCSRIYMVKLLL